MSVQEGGGRKEASRLQHIAVIIGMCAALAGGIGALLTVWWPAFDWAGHITSSVFMGALILVIRHDFRLCMYCIRDSPDDAPRRAQRKRHWLWTHHHVGLNVWFVGPFFLVFVITSIVASAFDWRVVENVATAAMTIPLATIWRAAWVHRGLVVWCPWCKGGGKEEKAPEPAPDPTLTKTGR